MNLMELNVVNFHQALLHSLLPVNETLLGTSLFMVVTLLLSFTILNILIYLIVFKAKDFLLLGLSSLLLASLLGIHYWLPDEWGNQPILFVPLLASLLTLNLIVNIYYFQFFTKLQQPDFVKFVLAYLIFSIPVMWVFSSTIIYLGFFNIIVYLISVFYLQLVGTSFSRSKQNYGLLTSSMIIIMVLFVEITFTLYKQSQFYLLESSLAIVLFIFSQHIVNLRQQWMTKEENAYDTLTGLYRIHHFIRRLNQEIERAKREGKLLFLSLIEIENLHQINHQSGYLAGDKSLINSANILSQSSRNFDLVCRVKGGRFALAQMVTNEADGKKLIQRIHHQINCHGIDFKGTFIQTKIRVGGIVLKPELSMEIEKVFQNLEKQILEAKTRQNQAIIVENEIVPSLAI